MHLTDRDATPYDERPARLDVGVVGVGRVGAVLGAALARAGHRVVAVSAVSQASRDRAEAMLPGVPVRDVASVVAAAELVLLTVPDDELAEVVSGLAVTGAWQPGQIAVHTSGRFGIGVLEPVQSAHVIPLAIHPAMTFSGTSSDLAALADCCFGVTAAEPARPVAEALVLEIGGEPVWIEEQDRARYHAALSHGANHLVTLVAQAMQVLTSAGVDAPDRVLGPLLGTALDNALRQGDAALTGPVARGDAGTVAAHLRELRSETPDVVYPSGEPSVRVHAGPLGDVLEGHSRPGHFDGVLTVVGKLLHLTGAQLAYFGQKDAQQLLLIRRMVLDLDFPVEVVAVPTVREPDGLAMSSRNMYLTDSDRESALSLSRALDAGSAAAAEGPSAVRRAARAVLVAEPLVAVDYLVLVHPETLHDVPEWYRGEALLAVAARVGTTRLIDNQPLTIGPRQGLV